MPLTLTDAACVTPCLHIVFIECMFLCARVRVCVYVCVCVSDEMAASGHND